ncbi:hypothetical protein [Brevibacillus fluminis]|nr:hypothetical protein [Brevibacillus fluminis]
MDHLIQRAEGILTSIRQFSPEMWRFDDEGSASKSSVIIHESVYMKRSLGHFYRSLWMGSLADKWMVWWIGPAYKMGT